MYFNASPRACALGFAGVSPLQGSLRTGLISYLSFVVLIIVFIGLCGCLRLLFRFIVRCGCLRLLFRFIVRCGCLRLLSDLLGGAGVSAVGTTLLQSPGCNEGKARNATLGKHRQKRIELRRSGTHSASIGFVALRFVSLHSLGKCRPFGAQ